MEAAVVTWPPPRGPGLLSVCRRDAADHAELAARADRRLGATIEEY